MKRMAETMTKRVFLYVSIVALVFLVVAKWISCVDAQQESDEYFRVTGGTVLSANEIRDQVGTGGNVTVVVDIASGQITGSKINWDAARSGIPGFGDAVLNVLNTWEFSGCGGGSIQYTIDIPAGGTFGEPRIDINLLGLYLNESCEEAFKKGYSSRQIQELARHEGFGDNIFIATLPKGITTRELSIKQKLLNSIWANLGGAFQTIFIILIIVLAVSIVLSVRNILTFKWAPDGKMTSIENMNIEMKKEDLIENFNSYPAGVIKHLWEKAIRMSTLDKDFLKPLEVTEEQLRKILSEVESSAKKRDITGALEEAHLLDVIKTCVCDMDTEEDDEKIKEEVKTCLQRILEINELVNDREKLINLPEEERDNYSNILWEYFGASYINKALNVCLFFKKEYPLMAIFESGLRNHLINRNTEWASQEIDRAIDRTAAIKVEERKGTLDVLWALGGICPMIGLFGTVWGISQAFGKIKGITDTKLLMTKLAGDINVALSTTIDGLILGLLSIITYYLFKYFIEHTEDKIEKYFTDITNLA